jgi:predicted DNA-binding protein (UPF0251 family)
MGTDPSEARAKSTVEWKRAIMVLEGKMAEDEASVLGLLADGLTQPEIGVQLGMHRSAVWRRVKKLRVLIAQATETSDGSRE